MITHSLLLLDSYDEVYTEAWLKTLNKFSDLLNSVETHGSNIPSHIEIIKTLKESSNKVYVEVESSITDLTKVLEVTTERNFAILSYSQYSNPEIYLELLVKNNEHSVVSIFNPYTDSLWNYKDLLLLKLEGSNKC